MSAFGEALSTEADGLTSTMDCRIWGWYFARISPSIACIAALPRQALSSGSKWHLPLWCRSGSYLPNERTCRRIDADN